MVFVDIDNTLWDFGTPLYTFKELLGHKSIAMTERYSHLAENTMRDAVKKLENKLKKRV